MRSNAKLSWLLLTTAAGAIATAPGALAAEAVTTAQNAGQPQAPAGLGADLLGEVVVTATRQADTVNRVPLSVTAVSQRAIDQSGVKNLDDLARMTPSVTFRRSTGGEANPNIAIRGLGSNLGATTTGIYLDDTPLQKRDGPGSASGNGSPLPPLFDLERVEVLRGPQGTLYGGSAQGGAIRFLTPQPSLTRYSVYAKTQVSTVKDGGESYEAGIAVGGPIIQDKLGFRASIYGRHEGGYVDAVSLRTGKLVDTDINTGNTKVARLAVTFSPVERMRITASVYGSYDHVSAQDVYWLSVSQYTLNPGTFTNAGTINGVRYNFPDAVFPGGTFGPYEFGPYKNGSAVFTARDGTETKINSPRNTYILLPTLTFDYDFDRMSVKSITSFLGDRNKGYAGQTLLGCRTTICPTATNAGFVGPTGVPVPGGFGSTPLGLAQQPDAYRQFTFFNVRNALVQEVRFSSATDQALTWVAGIYYINANTKQHTQSFDNENDTSRQIRGIDSTWGLGSTTLPGNNSSEREARTNENEIAAFGEANYMLTDKLKATAGVRVSRSSVTYAQINGGPVQGPPFGFVGTPEFATTGIIVTDPRCGYDATVCYGPNFRPFNDGPNDVQFRGFAGSQKESPVSPKFGLSYQATERNLFYASVAKGYRTGGLNQPVPVQTCLQDLNALGISETPLTYNSDTVWSYEGGAKIRLFGNTQINSSLFYIDWKNPQIGNRLRCGQIYTINAGKAVSKGFDIQAQSRFGPVTVSLSVARTDAKYTEGYTQVTTGAPIVIVSKGDELGAPDWQVALGLQYDFRIMSQYNAYIRGDYQYNGLYKRGVGPNSFGYNAFSYKGQATRYAQFRAGVTVKQVDLSAFVNNAFNSQDPLNLTNATRSPLITATTFRPREIGLQATYRY